MTIRATVVVFSGFLVSLITNCKSHSGLPGESLDSLATRQLGVIAERKYNPSKRYVIFQDSPDSASSQQPVRYAIYRTDNRHLELNGRFSNGHIRWIDDRTVEIMNVPDSVAQRRDLRPFIREVFIY